MALEFRPPQDLINAYLNRPSPGQIASEGVNQALQTYAQSKAAQQKNAIDQQAKDIEMAKGLSQGGQDFQAALDQIKAGRNAQQAPSGPSLIDRAKAFFTGSQTGKAPDASSGSPTNFSPPVSSSGTVPSPMTPGLAQNTAVIQSTMPTPSPAASPTPLAKPGGPTTDPLIQEYMVDPLAFKRNHGTQGIEKLKTQMEIDKGIEDKSKGPLQTITKEQAIKDGTFDPSKQIMVEPPAPRLDLGTKQDQFDQKEWDKIVKDTNPLTASNRTTLGMASKANFQADRALVTLSKPVVTNQEAGNAMADIAAIYQTGSPTQYGMSHQEYSTLYGKIQGALQSVTGKPQDALPDAIKNRLVGVLHDMKGTNSLVLKQQLDFTEKAKKRIIDKYPDEWKGIRSTLEDNPDMPGQTPIPGSGPHGASVSQNGHTYNWNQKTGQYE